MLGLNLNTRKVTANREIIGSQITTYLVLGKVVTFTLYVNSITYPYSKRLSRTSGVMPHSSRYKSSDERHLSARSSGYLAVLSNALIVSKEELC